MRGTMAGEPQRDTAISSVQYREGVRGRSSVQLVSDPLRSTGGRGGRRRERREKVWERVWERVWEKVWEKAWKGRDS